MGWAGCPAWVTTPASTKLSAWISTTGDLSTTSNCTCIKAPLHAAVNSLFSLVICHQVHVLLEAAFACHSVLHAQVIIYNSGSNFSPSQQRAQDTLPPCPPAIFPLRQSKSPSREFRECFFFQLRKSQGLLLNCWWVPWAWLQCAAFHTGSAPSLENVPQPLGQQLGSSWDGPWLGWDSEPEQRAKEGFYISGGFYKSGGLFFGCI